MIRMSRLISKWIKEITKFVVDDGGSGARIGLKGWVLLPGRNGRSCRGTSRTRRMRTVLDVLGLLSRLNVEVSRRRASRGGAATTKVFCLVVLFAPAGRAASFMVPYFRKQNRLGNPLPGVVLLSQAILNDGETHGSEVDL